MSPSYLRVSEASAELSVSHDTVLRRIAAGELPALYLNPRLIRVPARLLRPTAPPEIPWESVTVGAEQLAQAWQIHPRTLHRLAANKALPGRLRGGRWRFPVAELRKAVASLTVGVERAA